MPTFEIGTPVRISYGAILRPGCTGVIVARAGNRHHFDWAVKLDRFGTTHDTLESELENFEPVHPVSASARTMELA